jgi:hypothetical protein
MDKLELINETSSAIEDQQILDNAQNGELDFILHEVFYALEEQYDIQDPISRQVHRILVQRVSDLIREL